MTLQNFMKIFSPDQPEQIQLPKLQRMRAKTLMNELRTQIKICAS